MLIFNVKPRNILRNFVQNLLIFTQVFIKNGNQHVLNGIVVPFALIEVVGFDVQKNLHQSFYCLLNFSDNFLKFLKQFFIFLLLGIDGLEGDLEVLFREQGDLFDQILMQSFFAEPENSLIGLRIGNFLGVTGIYSFDCLLYIWHFLIMLFLIQNFLVLHFLYLNLNIQSSFSLHLFINHLFIHYQYPIVINSYLYIIYLMISTASTIRALSTTIRYNKIEFQKPDQPYNLRWQWKWKHAHYTYPNDGTEHAFVRKPEDAPETRPPFYTVYQDYIYRIFPTAKMYAARSCRLQDTFQTRLLPALSLFFYYLSELSFGFKLLALTPLAIFYTRITNKALDPDIKETFLRDMIHEHPEIGPLFKPETIHVLDYDLEYDEGFPDEEKFPEFNNKVFRFFNSDTSMCTGFFKFGDLDSGATMHLKFKTMPASGRFRFEVGEPFYYYDVRAEVTVDGVVTEHVIVDENEELKKQRPFLFLI